MFFKYLDIVSQQLPEVGNWSSHPWYGVNNKAITGADERQLQTQIQDWTAKLSAAKSQLIDVLREQNIECSKGLALDELELWITDLNLVPLLSGREQIDSFKNIRREDVSSLKQYVGKANDIAKSFADLCGVFNQGLLSDLNNLTKVSSAMQAIEAYGVVKKVRFDDLARSIGRLEASINIICSVEKKLGELIPHLPIIYKQELEQLFTINQVGFNELAGFAAHASALPSELLTYRDDIYDEESLPLIFTEFKNKQERLSSERERLSNIFKLERLPNTTEIRELSDIMKDSGFLSVFSGKWRKARKDIIAFSTTSKVDKQSISKALSDLAVWKESCQELKDSVEYQTAFGREFNGIDTNIARVETLMTWYKTVRKDYGIGFGSRTVMANALFSLNKDVFRGIQQLYRDGINKEISELLDNLNVLASIFTQVDCISDTQFKLSLNGEPLQRVLLELQINLEGVQKFLVNPNLEQTTVLKELEKLQIVSKERDKLTSEKVSERYFDGALDLELSGRGDLPKDFAVVEASLDYLSFIYDSLNNPALIELLTHRVTSDVVTYIVNSSDNLVKLKEVAIVSERNIMNLIDSDRKQWSKGCGLDINALCTRNELAVDSINWLDSWTKYLHAKDRMQEGGQGKLKDYLAGSQYNYEYGEQVMKFAVYTCLANEVYKEQPELSERSGHEQTAIQEQFRKYDDGLKELQRKRVAELAIKRPVDQGTSGARVSSYTGKFLLQHEISKQRGHIAIRKLVERAGDAMLGYKPCFMMSPMAVAKYLPPGKVQFDLVVMDEASQVKPEFALSCFARGKQAVVVGDPKQLPPTSFFDRATSNDDSDDDEDKGVINDSESILEAIGSHYPRQMLKWHYRSRHESLIDFSNRHFYDSELVVFPSPWAQSDEFGVKFAHVANGVFASGINNDEAKHIIGAVKQHVVNNHNESLGIVAMNSKQRDQIEALLEVARTTDQALDASLKRDAQTADPLFIKNLENVQGDERDVIIISFTYGPQNRGSSSIPQRFGPINSDQGWRRLNVLFTRAKKRIQVYSSMRSEQIVVTNESKRGVRALKNYLAYAESGDLTDQSGDSQGIPDSDFEIAVMKQLNVAGYECVPQVGVAGFKIDVGVRDPGMPGRYLMGIECDGATYHSSKSTRDRDRVRQGVLEGLGWNIKRVWSTDWFKNPDAELKPIIDELNHLATPVREGVAETESPIDVINKHSATEPVQLLHQHVSDAKVQEELKLNEVQSVQTLSSRLSDFGKNIIEREFPNTDKTKRLLRPEMIDMLDAERPINLDEFAEYVPKYLRTYTSTDEAATFLGDVLEIIAVYEEMHSNVDSA